MGLFNRLLATKSLYYLIVVPTELGGQQFNIHGSSSTMRIRAVWGD